MSTTNDTLLIVRQAELPDLLALGVLTPEQDRMGYLSYGDLSLEQRAIVDQQLTALGVGKPEQVRVSDLRALAALPTGVGDLMSESRGVAGFHLNGDVASWDEFQFLSELGGMREAASRIERAIGEKS